MEASPPVARGVQEPATSPADRPGATPPAGNGSRPAALAGTFWRRAGGGPPHFATWSCTGAGTEQATWHHAGEFSVGLHGEIHNLGVLRRALGLPEHAGSGTVLQHAWARWAGGLLARLDGVFSLIIRSAEALVLYRDPSGLRNLYVTQNPQGQVTFATHLAAMPAGADGAWPVARPSVHEYLRHLEVVSPNTLRADVTSLEAGRPWRWPEGDSARHPTASTTAPPASALDYGSAVARLESLLRRSVRVRLAGAERPAAFLSGGVDSSLICALAAAQCPKLVAVTVGFDDEAFDESPTARRVADHLGLAHEVWGYTHDQYRAAFDRLSREAEQPMADPAAMATLMTFERCRDRFDVVLDGTGADEAVGLMPPRHARVAVAHASRLPRAVRLGAAGLLKHLPALSRYTPILDFEHPADTMSRWHGFRRAEIERLTGSPASLERTQFIQTYHRFPRSAHFERYSALLNAMGCDRLNQAVAVSGATVRYPFWDRKSLDFIRSLRRDFRYLPGKPKRILKSVLARLVPISLWDAPKHGFNFPLRRFLAAEDFDLVRQYLDGDRWRAGDWLCADEVRHYGERFMAGDASLTFRVWALVVLAAWLEHHPASTPAAA